MESAALMRANNSEDAIRVLVGMQPQFRQVPPNSSLSTKATEAPSCAARIAAGYPPGPAPMTTRSNAATGLSPQEFFESRSQSAPLARRRSGDDRLTRS